MNLKNKKILITGATGGIGNCLVEKFINLGSNVFATGTNEEKLENIKRKFSNVEIGRFKLDDVKAQATQTLKNAMPIKQVFFMVCFSGF